ncbi:hypothetical protein NPIL_503541 [Nephila pilipes]|uniref:Uncharacterized protein n=1 Tax=Nephila pilipes TaxID=299642 RepID=A0A8X6NPM9_NEPPI|nr:hypothetical protein NPIL_503541 [Nephila pilipes]
MNLVESIIEKFNAIAPRPAKRYRLQSDSPLLLTARHFPYLAPSTFSMKNALRNYVVGSGKKIRLEYCYQCTECDIGLCVQLYLRMHHMVAKF